MESAFSFVIGLLTAALSLLGFVQQHPELPKVQRDQAQRVTQQAITHAAQALTSPTNSQPSQNAPSKGSLSVSTMNGAAPLTVTFSIQQSAGGQFIDFGDGSNPCSPMTAGFTMDEGGCNAPAYPQAFTHTYTSPGTYKVVASRRFPSSTLGTATITVTGRNQGAVSVSGMSKYTDTDFGFSFWYPSHWTVTNMSQPGQGMFAGTTDKASNLSMGRIVLRGDGREINIDKVHSDERTYRVAVGACGYCGPMTYYYDANRHEWMKVYPNGANGGDMPQAALEAGKVPKPADISINTMGGLHMFSTEQKESAVIVPLSARNFVLVTDVTYTQQCGPSCGDGASVKGGAQFLAKTIIATDPSVATPVSAAEQRQTIQAEAAAY